MSGKKTNLKNWSKPDYELNSPSSNINFEDITILIPTLNEEEAIKLVINDVRTQGFSNILVVDGKSTDRTTEIVKKEKVKIIEQVGQGKTKAIISALDHIKTPYFALIDGDCTYGASDLEHLIPLMNGTKEVIGVRKRGRENITQLNRFGNNTINKLFNLIFGTNLSDVCSGMYLLETDFVRSIPFKTDGFDVEVEIAAFASVKGKIKEHPINFYRRIGDQKLQPFRDGYKIITSIFKLGLRIYPSRVLSLLAVLLFFPGIFLLSYSMFFLNVFNQSVSLLGLIMIVISIQGITIYLVDRMIKNNSTK